MFEHFYHEIFRKTVIAFGTLFNGIVVKRINEQTGQTTVLKVPLAYGPTQKFLARIEESPNLNKPVQITLPRMSFELVGLNYDSSRKLTTTQTFKAKSLTNETEIKKAFMPVPYNMSFELTIMSKLNDEMLQIIEQILPYFQPMYTVSVNLVENVGEVKDIPIVLDNISMDDQYEGDYSTRRALIYTLRFTAKTYLFGPITSATSDIIRKVSIGYVADRSGSRDLTYTVTPVATKNYTGNVTTTLAEDIVATDTQFAVADASSIVINSYIDINDETIFVKSKNGNALTVNRSQYNTVAVDHVSGSNVMLITTTDNDLIELGDDFGFSGNVF